MNTRRYVSECNPNMIVALLKYGFCVYPLVGENDTHKQGDPVTMTEKGTRKEYSGVIVSIQNPEKDEKYSYTIVKLVCPADKDTEEAPVLEKMSPMRPGQGLFTLPLDSVSLDDLKRIQDSGFKFRNTVQKGSDKFSCEIILRCAIENHEHLKSNIDELHQIIMG
jgi:hypothetical protein